MLKPAQKAYSPCKVFDTIPSKPFPLNKEKSLIKSLVTEPL